VIAQSLANEPPLSVSKANLLLWFIRKPVLCGGIGIELDHTSDKYRIVDEVTHGLLCDIHFPVDSSRCHSVSGGAQRSGDCATARRFATRQVSPMKQMQKKMEKSEDVVKVVKQQYQAVLQELVEQKEFSRQNMILNEKLMTECDRLHLEIASQPGPARTMAEICKNDKTGKLTAMSQNNLNVIRNTQKGVNATRGNRFSQPLLVALLHVHSKHKGVLSYLSKELLIGAACKSTLEDCLEPFRPELGFGKKAHTQIQRQKVHYGRHKEVHKGQGKPDNEGQLSMDEINHIGLATYKSKSCTFTGWNINAEQLQSLEPVYAMLKDGAPLLCQYTMACMWTCHATKYSFLGPLVSSPSGLKWWQITHYFHKVVEILEKYDFHVDLCVLDGAAPNEKFVMKMCGMDGSSGNIAPRCRNHVTGKMIIFVFDPPHMLKNIRNQLFKSVVSGNPRRFTVSEDLHDFLLTQPTLSEMENKAQDTDPAAASGCKPCSERIFFGYKEVCEHGEQVRAHSNTNMYPSQLYKFFTVDHWKLTPRTKMRVHLAKQVFHDTTVSSFEEVSLKYPQDKRWSALVLFMKAVQKIYVDVCFSKVPVQSMKDPRVTTLLKGMMFFELWDKDVHSDPVLSTFSPKERNKHFISSKTWFQLRVTVTGILKFVQHRLSQGHVVCLSGISQSPLEDQFGRARGQQHGTGKLTLVNLLCSFGNNSFSNEESIDKRDGVTYCTKLGGTGDVYMEELDVMANKRKRKRKPPPKK
jgi:hypothetical protein